jgi:hypothetical protein
MLVTDEEATKAMQWMVDNASAIAKAAAEVEYLREFRKSLKAMQMEKSGRESVSAAEMHAYASPEYRDHLLGQKTAVYNYERLKFLFKGAELKVEVWRTSCANARSVR